MKHSQRDTVHRVRAVRSWLEKAEASFDEESDIKGELNLMLAEAEMKNLRKHHPVSRNWLRAGAMVTSFFLALGGWYAFRRKNGHRPSRPSSRRRRQGMKRTGTRWIRLRLWPSRSRQAACSPLSRKDQHRWQHLRRQQLLPETNRLCSQPRRLQPYRNRQQRLRYGWQGRQS